MGHSEMVPAGGLHEELKGPVSETGIDMGLLSRLGTGLGGKNVRSCIRWMSTMTSQDKKGVLRETLSQTSMCSR
jgi:hypothetical protein